MEITFVLNCFLCAISDVNIMHLNFCYFERYTQMKFTLTIDMAFNLCAYYSNRATYVYSQSEIKCIINLNAMRK